MDLLCLPGLELTQNSSDRMRQQIVAGLKFLSHRAWFNIRLVAQEISNIYSLNLPLSYEVYAAVARIALRRWGIDQLLAILVQCGRV